MKLLKKVPVFCFAVAIYVVNTFLILLFFSGEAEYLLCYNDYGLVIVFTVGATGTLNVIAVVLTALVPQAFVAVTEILPLVEFGVAVIEAVLLLPVQPEGNVHV